MAPLRYAAKFDPFLSLECAPTPSTLAQSKERKGSIFAIWQPWEKDGDVINETFTESYPDLLISELYIENITGADAGDYECLSGNSVVSEIFLSVLSNDSLLIPVEEDERLVMVPAGGKRVIPCR